MFKPILLVLITIVMISSQLSAQESYADGKVSVSTTILKHEDPKNDIFYDYYNINLKNETDEVQKFRLVIVYEQNGKTKTSVSRDENNVFKLEPGEELSGEEMDRKDLILFKSFLPGKSGSKASNSSNEIKSLEVNYL